MKIIKLTFLLISFTGFCSSVFSDENTTTKNFFFSQDSIVVQDSSLLVDTSKIADSLKVKTIVDTLLPIGNQSFSDDSFSYKLMRSEIEELNYSGAGDLFEYIPFGLKQDLGSPGQPDEIFLYGNGFGGISYLMDGIPINYRLTNSFDLNLISPEIIDSLEVLPLTSGFIYNNFNNPVTVNFLTKDKIAARPYSKIRYYQAPDEGFIDGMFNAYLMSRMNLFLNFTNATFDDQNNYRNSYSNSWKANIRLRYLLSKKISLVGTYNYAKSETGLFGGLNSEISEGDLFNISRRDAGVNYLNRYQKKRRNNFDLKILGRIIKNSPTELKLYYQFALNEFRLNENVEVDSTEARIKNNNKYNLVGISFRQKLNFSLMKIDFISNYERIDPKADFISKYTLYTILSNSLKADFRFRKIYSFGIRKNFKLHWGKFNRVWI